MKVLIQFEPTDHVKGVGASPRQITLAIKLANAVLDVDREVKTIYSWTGLSDHVLGNANLSLRGVIQEGSYFVVDDAVAERAFKETPLLTVVSSAEKGAGDRGVDPKS